jgi:hypothetical protein
MHDPYWVTVSRDIRWDGFFNARDLGGLQTRTGRTTRPGAFVRSADLRFVTNEGWRAARDYGIRTVLDLRNDDEIRPTASTRPTALAGSAQFTAATDGATTPAGVERLEVALDDIGDVAFWQHLNREQLNGTPLYYRPFLEHKPDRCAATITALARATSGGVLFHCGAGRDRTGLISLLLLALADVEPDEIATDYTLSREPLKALSAKLGVTDQGPMVESTLASRGTTIHAAVLDILDNFDAESYLLSAGVDQADIQQIRDRLLG